MKTISLLAAIFLGVALVGPAAEAGRIPFHGTMEASESYQEFGNPPFVFFVNAGGTATATNLCQLTLVYTFIVDAATGDGIGSARYIAPNGDSIFTSTTAVSGPSGNDFVVAEMHTVTGGTGRFAGAKGSFTVNRTIDQSAATTSGSFHGFLILRGHH